MPRAGVLRHRGAGRQHRSADLDGGRAKITIPEGTQSGPPVPHSRQGHAGAARRRQTGDLYVEVAVETPVKLTRKQKELLRDFEKEAEEGTHPETEGFFAKVKEFWSHGDEA